MPGSKDEKIFEKFLSEKTLMWSQDCEIGKKQDITETTIWEELSVIFATTTKTAFELKTNDYVRIRHTED